MPPTDLSLARRVDTACDRFEDAWRKGKKPRIEDFLGNAIGNERVDLIKALIAVEIELRRGAGEEVKPGPYRKRFADSVDAVASAFADPGRSRTAGDTSISRESVKTGDFEARSDTARPAATDVPKKIGRFAVIGVLGAGAFGRVYRAKDPQLGRDVAIKVPLPSAIGTSTDRERFQREARAAAGLHHPNICPVHEVGDEDGQPFIVMGFVPGQSLAATLKARKEPLAAKQAALIARKLALALDAAHKKGIVHRDLKPANVMFDRERRDVVITDFGLARAPRFGDTQTTREGIIMGTPAYMSPEQARGDTKAVGPASDIFALGIMLYEMLTGQRPFSGSVTEVIGKILHVEPESPKALRPDLDPGLAAICLKAMAKDPAARFASMREFADALLTFASDAPASRPLSAPASASAETAKGATETQRIAEVFAFTEQAVEKAIRKHRTPMWMKVGIGVLLLIGLVVPGIVFFARTPTATVEIKIDVDVHDKSLAFFLDGKQIEGEALTHKIELKVGKHVLEVKKNGQSFRRYEFNVSKDAGPRIELKEDVPKDNRPPISEDGFITLFNGKDLTGWQLESSDTDNWKVEGGAIMTTGVGAMPKNETWLLSEKTYGDCIVRFDFAAEPPTAESGFALRAVPGEKPDSGKATKSYPTHLQLDLIATANEAPKPSGPQLILTRARSDGNALDYSQSSPVDKQRKAGEWNQVEIEIRGQTLQVRLNGELILEPNLDDLIARGGKHPGLTRKSGRVGFQRLGGTVRFRNIRIRELASVGAADPDRIAAEWMLSIGAEFKINVDGKVRDIRTATDLPKEPFQVMSVNLAWNKKVTDTGLVSFKGCNDLTHLSIGDTAVTDTGLAYFKDCKKLEQLNFHGAGITNAGLAHFKDCKNLESLVLGFTGVTDAGLAYFKDCKKLKLLDLEATKVTIPAIRDFQQALPDCKIRPEFKANPPKKEVPEVGFIRIFNGKDLNDWQTNSPEEFSVDADGTLLAKGDTPGSLRWLMTKKEYSDFNLRFEYQIIKSGATLTNTGVTFRAIPERTGANGSKLEVQIRSAAIKPITGALIYSGADAVEPTESPVLKPPGDWNSIEIEAIGPRVKVTVNGKLVNDVDLTKVDRTKLNKKEIGPSEADLDRKIGRIGLQSFRGPVKFRNVRIKDLSK